LEDALLNVMNTAFSSALHFDAGLPAFLALLLAFCAVSFLLGAFFVLVRLRSTRNVLDARTRELRSIRQELGMLSLKNHEIEDKFQAVFENSLYSIAISGVDGTYLGPSSLSRRHHRGHNYPQGPEDRLRQSEEKFASIFRLSPDAIVLFGLER
jgi:hypothetical protein